MPDPIDTWTNTSIDIKVDVNPTKFADKVRLSLRPPDPISPTYDGGDTIYSLSTSPSYLKLYGSLKYGNNEPDTKNFMWDFKQNEKWKDVSGETEITQRRMDLTIKPVPAKLPWLTGKAKNQIESAVKKWADEAEATMREQGHESQANQFQFWRTVSGGDEYLKKRADDLFNLAFGVPGAAWDKLDKSEINDVDLTDKGSALAFDGKTWDWKFKPKVRLPIGDLAKEIDDHGLPGVLQNPNLFIQGVEAGLKYKLDSDRSISMDVNWDFGVKLFKFNDDKIEAKFNLNSRGRHDGSKFSVGATFEINTENGDMKAIGTVGWKF